MSNKEMLENIEKAFGRSSVEYYSLAEHINANKSNAVIEFVYEEIMKTRKKGLRI